MGDIEAQPGGRRVAIMQPTFLPWLGYFALMETVGTFVFLDDVQLDRRSWQTRNRLKGPGGEVVLSVGISGRPSRVPINEARLADGEDFQKIRRAIEYSLGRAPFYPLVRSLVEEAFEGSSGMLATLNIGLIEGVARAAGIAASRVRSSELPPSSKTREERLLEICEHLGAAEYVSPPGSFNYLRESDPFAASSIALRFLTFQHPEYPQLHPPFLPFISAIDALAHVGPEGLRPLIQSGLRPDRSRADLEADHGQAI